MGLPLKLNDTHRRVLHLIRWHQPVTRARISDLSGLGSGQITQTTRDLLLAGLIAEGERIRGGRGQPALPLSINPGGALSFGVSMIPGGLRIVATDFAGGVVEDVETRTASNGPETVAQIVAEQIEAMARRYRLRDRGRMLGVGFAIPGFFYSGHKRMRVVEEHASWRDEPLAERFSDLIGLPCWVENDATAAGLGEFYRRERPFKSMITLFINYGIGCGLILGGQPFVGGFGNAGEVGAFFPVEEPRPSGTDLLNALQAEGIAARALHDLDWDDTAQRPMLEAWSKRAGPQLATLINMAWSWMDPDLVVLSGALPSGLLQQLLADVQPEGVFARHPDRPHPEVLASDMGASVSAVGAAHLPLHALGDAGSAD